MTTTRQQQALAILNAFFFLHIVHWDDVTQWTPIEKDVARTAKMDEEGVSLPNFNFVQIDTNTLQHSINMVGLMATIMGILTDQDVLFLCNGPRETNPRVVGANLTPSDNNVKKEIRGYFL